MDNRVVETPVIFIEGHGIIPEQVVQAIHQQVQACYEMLTVPLPHSVSLSLFDTMSRWREYATKRRTEAGVVTAGEEGFLATHDAWEGRPRLNVCVERLLAHPEPVQQGALHQVVAHSVLHGEPAYYRFLIPRSFVEISQIRGVELELLQQVLYFVSIAVKGYEAVSLLVEHHFILDQIALARYQLEGTEDDAVLWKTVRWEPRARLLYRSAQLKPLLYAQPLLPHDPSLLQDSRNMLAHLPPEEIERLEAMVETLIAQRTGNTHQDVAIALGLALDRL